MNRIFSFALLCLLSASLFAAENLVIEFSQGEASSIDEAFTELISSEKPVVIKFTMLPCGPCKKTEEPFRAMASVFKHKATFVKIDIRHYRSIANRLRIETIPAWAIFVQGKLIGEILTGSYNLSILKTLRTNLEAYISSHKIKIVE